MQFVRNDLDKLTTQRFEVESELEFDQDVILNHPRITALRDIFAEGHAYYDRHSSRLITDIEVSGIMTVPCAITLKPFDREFAFKLGDMYSFDPLTEEDIEDGVEAVDGDTLDMDPYILEAVLAEVPLKAIHPDLETYPEGDGWQVMTEEDYIKQKNQEIDPRLAKLKDFKFE